jgi:hypothetical protein
MKREKSFFVSGVANKFIKKRRTIFLRNYFITTVSSQKKITIENGIFYELKFIIIILLKSSAKKEDGILNNNLCFFGQQQMKIFPYICQYKNSTFAVF